MQTLKGESVLLRALEPEDLEFLFSLENDETYWEISSTSTPFSRYILKQYLEHSHKDIFEVKQLRLMICGLQGERIGLIDLFDYDPKNRRAAVGIIIKDKNDRRKGMGAESLELLRKYAFHHLDMHQLYACVASDNLASIRLFETCGFELTGQKKDWIHVNGSYKNEILFQFINKHVH